MFDIGAMEIFLVAVVALVVVGPKELPRLLRTVGGLVRRMRELAADFKDGVEQLAAEADRQTDPFADLREKEGLRPGMSPDEITNHIMRNREREADERKKAESKKPESEASKPENDEGAA
ncbi:MAG: twin-arginine translocase subunit TatB [Alphaproteobacteria bacterium]|nr:twin-arginine translocase subunit TatB [Alphaproteobacteria bacterium]